MIQNDQNKSQMAAEHSTRQWLMGETEFYKLPSSASLVKPESETKPKPTNPRKLLAEIYNEDGIGVSVNKRLASNLPHRQILSPGKLQIR